MLLLSYTIDKKKARVFKCSCFFKQPEMPGIKDELRTKKKKKSKILEFRLIVIDSIQKSIVKLSFLVLGIE